MYKFVARYVDSSSSSNCLLTCNLWSIASSTVLRLQTFSISQHCNPFPWHSTMAPKHRYPTTVAASKRYFPRPSPAPSVLSTSASRWGYDQLHYLRALHFPRSPLPATILRHRQHLPEALYTELNALPGDSFWRPQNELKRDS